MTFKILYVDDEADLREIAQISLELDPTLEVRTCSSGHEALALAKEWEPDVVLLDVMMPVMDGPQTLSCLREQAGSALPIVFITARAGASEARQLLDLGAQGVIAKPFNPMELAAEVRAYLRDE
jgi:CheY-like chemotaxis protein